MLKFEIFLDNIVFSIQKFGGAATYWTELLKRFVTMDNVKIISQNQNKDIYDDQGKIYNEATTPDKFLLETLLPSKLLRYLPLTTKLPARSVYHNSYYRTSFQKDIVKIFTIHDFTHKRGLASKFPRNLVHISLTAMGLKKADGIISISENTKNDLIKYYPGIDQQKIKVIYHGVNEDFYPLDKDKIYTLKSNINISEPFILFIGKRDGYKNFDLVVDALSKVNDIKLYAVGGEPMTEEQTTNLSNKLPGGFEKLAGLNNANLNILYNYAFALVYPSLYEGFGFPVAEAMRAGCPVIVTRLSSIPEVAGDAGLYIDNLAAEDVIAKVNELREPTTRDIYISKGFKQSQKFLWEKCAAETFEFYKETYNRKYDL